MGNSNSTTCTNTNGATIVDQNGSKCYTSSAIVNVKGLKGVSYGSNTTVLISKYSDGNGDKYPLEKFYDDPEVGLKTNSVIITVNDSSLSAGYITCILICIILLVLISYGGNKYYNKFSKGNSDGSSESNSNEIGGGYYKLRY